jgi:hypothetical protein
LKGNEGVRGKPELQPVRAPCCQRLPPGARPELEFDPGGVDRFNIYLMTHSQEETLEAYGRDVLPQFSEGPGVS